MVKTRGGGHKQNARLVDNNRRPPEGQEVLEERVKIIQYDPTRSARIALVVSGVDKRYILASEGMKEGDLITSNFHIPDIVGRFSYIFDLLLVGTRFKFFCALHKVMMDD